MALDALTEDQISAVKEAFALYDKDADGAISTKELGAFMRSIGLSPTQADVQEVLTKTDPKSTGSIQLSDFLNHLPNALKDLDTEDELREAFKLFDKNGSGTISVEELRQLLMSLGDKLTDAELEDMLKEAQLQENGQVDYADFVRLMLAS